MQSRYWTTIRGAVKDGCGDKSHIITRCLYLRHRSIDSRFSIYDIPFTIGFMAGRRDFAFVAPQSRNFHQPARRYQRRTRVFTFDISNTSISLVTSCFWMNLSTLSDGLFRWYWHDVSAMSRIPRNIVIGIYEKKFLTKLLDEKNNEFNIEE